MVPALPCRSPACSRAARPYLASPQPPPPLLSVSRQYRRRRAALALYAATLISTRVGTPTLLWTAANLAFALPAALKAGALPKVCTAPCTAAWISAGPSA